ncbi:MAG: 3-oxoacyl-[acyl-carrier protein] reductase [Chlamydiota bacterium]|jgi:3-oxoacyl-[acyl-carrier protein] reductase|nr:3-oxoacyl-[acyl-carrier protein] reductase [Chlamydiota bacterium]
MGVFMSLLANKNALITGGTAGIGKAIALAFLQQGANVAILGTNKDHAVRVVEELQSAKINQQQRIESFLVDVSNKLEVDNIVKDLILSWISIDILVNNAGITRDGLLIRMSEEDFDRVIEVNLKALFNLCRSVVPHMVKARSGNIINISSIVASTGNPGQFNYAASKAGVEGASKVLAKEVASRNIRINCIAPGFIQTRMTDKLTEAQKEHILSQIPLKAMGKPEDIANAAVFLASHLSSYITGQILTVDGGMVM